MCSSPPFKSYKKKGFINSLLIQLSSGKGGKGAVHFQRTRRSLRAGPDGGDGGDGGDLILSPKDSLVDLSHLKPGFCYRAEDGKPGGGGKKKGAKGQNLIIYVPKGTICYDSTGQNLKELKEKSWCVLKGGKGGKGNHFFKSSRRQAPQLAQPGQPAKQSKLMLSLRKRDKKSSVKKKPRPTKYRLGVFGASFNPPHLGHLNLLVQAQKKFNFDLIKVVPAFQNPLLPSLEEATPLKRLELTRKVFKRFAFVEVDDREIKRKGASYTIDTVKSLEKELPIEEIFLIMGIDQWAYFDRWKNFKALLNRAHLVVGSRKGYDWLKDTPPFFKKYISNKSPSLTNSLEEYKLEEYKLEEYKLEEYKIPLAGSKNIYWLPLKDRDVSSSQIRDLVSQKKKVDHLVPSLVDQWIKQENPYCDQEKSQLRKDLNIKDFDYAKTEEKSSTSLKTLKYKKSNIASITQFFVETLLEKKAQKVRTFDLTGFPKIPFDFTLVASGLNTRHTQALASHLQKEVKKRFSFHDHAMEGQELGEWIVLDYGALVVHIFYDYKREYYRLEELWNQAPRKDFSSGF